MLGSQLPLASWVMNLGRSHPFPSLQNQGWDHMNSQALLESVSGSLSLFVMLLSFLASYCISAKYSVSVAQGLLAADPFVTRLSADFRVGPGKGGRRPSLKGFRKGGTVLFLLPLAFGGVSGTGHSSSSNPDPTSYGVTPARTWVPRILPPTFVPPAKGWLWLPAIVNLWVALLFSVCLFSLFITCVTHSPC